MEALLDSDLGLQVFDKIYSLKIAEDRRQEKLFRFWGQVFLENWAG